MQGHRNEMRNEAESKAHTSRQPLRGSSGSDSESGDDIEMGGWVL